MSQKVPKIVILLGVAATAAAVVFSQARIAQDPAYHVFADARPWLGVPNGQNVWSNLPFLVAGLWGLAAWWRRGRPGVPHAEDGGKERAGWFCLFFGISLTAFGSAYYHWQPDNASLFWDRLPMTLGFTGLYAAIIGERISHHAYRLLLWPLVGLGVASVMAWYVGETQGQGDLRLYALVQFFPLLTIPLIMALYEARWSHGYLIFVALGWYLAAKALEHFDAAVWSATGETVSGHALKHLAAAVGCAFLASMYARRRRLGGAASTGS
jgi:hypothetical protein